MSKTTIKTNTVGRSFGCEARVRTGGKLVHVTAVYPYGMERAAEQAARDWVAQQAKSVA